MHESDPKRKRLAQNTAIAACSVPSNTDKTAQNVLDVSIVAGETHTPHHHSTTSNESHQHDSLQSTAEAPSIVSYFHDRYDSIQHRPIPDDIILS